MSGKDPGDCLLNGLRRRARTLRVPDRPTNDDVIGAVHERLLDADDPLLIVGWPIVHGADARRDDQQSGIDHLPEPRRFQAGRYDAVATGLERATRTGEY